MADLSHLEYLFTRDSFTGHARPDPSSLLGPQSASNSTAAARAQFQAGAQTHGLSVLRPEDGASGYGRYYSALPNQQQATEASVTPYLDASGRVDGLLSSRAGVDSRMALSRYAQLEALAEAGMGGGVGFPGGLPGTQLGAAALALAKRNLNPEDLIIQSAMARSAASKARGGSPPRAAVKPASAGKPPATPPAKGKPKPKPKEKEKPKEKVKAVAAATGGAPKARSSEIIICQVCNKEVPSDSIRKYIRVRKVCNDCRISDCVIKNGKEMRFCQLCSWFHPLDSFEGKRHSCKNALQKHNERRRQKTVKAKTEDES